MAKPPCRCSNYTTFGQCRPFDSAHGQRPWASLRIPPHGSLEGATGSARGAPHIIDTAMWQAAYPRMRQGSADTTMVTNKCPECGQTMWRQEGCMTCPVCGFSRC